MTNTQKLSLRLSEVRQKLNELSAKDELTDGEQNEMRTLFAEYARALRYGQRAALIADGGTDHADPWRIWPLDDGARAITEATA